MDTCSSLILIFFAIMMFHTLDQLIECHGNGAENDDRGDHHIKLEYLGTVNDQIAESAPCGKKFSDDHTYEGEADVDLHIAQNKRDGGGKDNLKERISPCTAQRIDQLEHFRICLTKSRVEINNGTKYGNGDSGNDDGVCSGSEPDNQKRRQR